MHISTYLDQTVGEHAKKNLLPFIGDNMSVPHKIKILYMHGGRQRHEDERSSQQPLRLSFPVCVGAWVGLGLWQQ
jgi:hypothetical protein